MKVFSIKNKERGRGVMKMSELKIQETKCLRIFYLMEKEK